MNLLVVIGEPASGKSSLVRALTDPLAYSIEKKPFWHTVYFDKDGQPVGAQLGWTPEYGEQSKFGGSDRLAFDVIKNAVKFSRTAPYPNLIVEGDRLANSRFIDGAMSAGINVEIVVVEVPAQVRAARIMKRGHKSAVWDAGRGSKVATLSEEYAAWIVERVDGTIDHDSQIRRLAESSRVVKAFVEAW